LLLNISFLRFKLKTIENSNKMEDNNNNNNNNNKGRNFGCSNNWCSQDGTTQKYYGYSGKIKSRARLNYHKSKRSFNFIGSPLNLLHPSPPDVSTSNDNNGSNNLKNGLMISGIVIGSSILLAIIIYFVFRFIRKRKNSSGSQEDEEALPNPRELTLNFVKHNHHIPELCTTPDTQPILDYYSSKAGLTNISSPPVINSNDSNSQIHKSTPVEVEESPEENINNGYVPQYYNGIEIPPLGARIIPLERQIQIAKELTSNLNHINNKRKSNRSISSILSISSRRKSSTSNATMNCHNNNNNNSSTTLTLIRETSRNENAANVVP